MSAKFTPGLWEAIVQKPTRKDPAGTAMVRAGGTQAIACDNSGTSFAESAANARLIAAAPELLSALQLMLRTAEKLYASLYYSEPHEHAKEPEFMQARAAIARALGEA